MVEEIQSLDGLLDLLQLNALRSLQTQDGGIGHLFHAGITAHGLAQGGGIPLYVEDIVTTLPDLLSFMKSRGLAFKRLECRKMNLDDLFLYKLHPTRPQMLTEGPTAEEGEALEAHVQYLEQLAAKDVVLFAGRTQVDGPEGFGIVVLRATSESDARAVMEADPGVSRAVMSAALFPYRIAVLGRSLGGPAA